MDVVAAYAEKYGGVPRDEQSWHEVLSLVARIPGFEARQKIIVADGTALSRPAMDAAAGTMRQMLLRKLERQAAFEKVRE